MLRISRGSAAELRTQAYIARKTDLITSEEMNQITSETREIARMISGLIRIQGITKAATLSDSRLPTPDALWKLPMPRAKTFADASKAIGDTPMIQINRLVPQTGATVFAKCEFFQPLNSVKDRIGVAMIEAGERDGKINADTHVIEPTSGNTGIALAFVCAAKGYKLTLTMPESMSVERRALLRAMGANLVLTPAGEGMKGAINRAAELVESTPMRSCLNNSKIPPTRRFTKRRPDLRFGKTADTTSTCWSPASEPAERSRAHRVF